GNQDVLAWASSGGTGPDAANDPGNLDQVPNALVSTQSFNAVIEGSLGAMFGTYPNLQGVILNIPNITLIPFFQAVKWNAIPMDQATADATNSAFAGFNGFLNQISTPEGGSFITPEEAAYRQITFEAGNNEIVINDDQMTDLTDAIMFYFNNGFITEAQRDALLPFAIARQMKSAADESGLVPFGLPGEIVTLSAGSVLGQLADPGNPASVIGVGVPLGDEFTLTVDELGKLLMRIGAFNAKIAEQAGLYENLKLYDANTLFTSIAISGGYTIENGFTYSPDFSPNGIFSTDGVHPNPAGHAILANELMDLIEDEFGADLPAYDVSDFSTILIAQ
ncbi:MAG: hypothetical protein R3345_07610, partial [Fulvivirga sp.]|nr:hypothetical protein [Fulvivirga sp.]